MKRFGTFLSLYAWVDGAATGRLLGYRGNGAPRVIAEQQIMVPDAFVADQVRGWSRETLFGNAVGQPGNQEEIRNALIARREDLRKLDTTLKRLDSWFTKQYKKLVGRKQASELDANRATIRDVISNERVYSWFWKLALQTPDDEDKMRTLLLKALLVLETSGDFKLIHREFQEACRTIMQSTTLTHASLGSARGRAMCENPSVPHFVDNLNIHELDALLEMRRMMKRPIKQFLADAASDELIAEVSRIPVETAPVEKYICVVLRIAESCDRFIKQWRFVEAMVPNWQVLLPALRELYPGDFAPVLADNRHSLAPLSLYLDVESPIGNEVAKMTSEFWHILSSPNHWPLFQRLLFHSSVRKDEDIEGFNRQVEPPVSQNLDVELEFAHVKGPAVERACRISVSTKGFQGSVPGITEFEILTHHVCSLLVDPTPENLNAVLSGASTVSEFVESFLPDANVVEFMKYRMRDHRFPTEPRCPICLIEFNRQANTPVNFCTGTKSVCHYVCRACVPQYISGELTKPMNVNGYVRHQNFAACPTCRKPVYAPGRPGNDQLDKLPENGRRDDRRVHQSSLNDRNRPENERRYAQAPAAEEAPEPAEDPATVFRREQAEIAESLATLSRQQGDVLKDLTRNEDERRAILASHEDIEPKRLRIARLRYFEPEKEEHKRSADELEKQISHWNKRTATLDQQEKDLQAKLRNLNEREAALRTRDEGLRKKTLRLLAEHHPTS